MDITIPAGVVRVCEDEEVVFKDDEDPRIIPMVTPSKDEDEVDDNDGNLDEDNA